MHTNGLNVDDEEEESEVGWQSDMISDVAVVAGQPEEWSQVLIIKLPFIC